MQDSSFHHGASRPLSLSSPAAFGGVLGCVDCTSVALQQCEVWNLSAPFGGVLAVRKTGASGALFLSIQACRFEACTASTGGVVFAQNVSFTIHSSVFLGNSAETGGALFTALKPTHSGTVTNSTFTDNRAVEGGVVKWSNAEVQFSNTSFLGNWAQYGPDIASYGVALSSRYTQLTGQEASGAPLTLLFELLDHYNHRVTLSPFRSLRLLSTAAVSYLGNQVCILAAGWFNYSDFTIYAAPATSQLVTAQLTASQEDFSLTLQHSILVSFRNCSPGEVKRTDRCEPCYAGNYSFSPEDSCSFCPANAFCPGGSQVQVNSGFWRSSQNSSQVLPCPFPQHCQGGQNSSCDSAYTAPLCNRCTQLAYPKRALECCECSHPAFHILQLAAALGLAVLLAWLVLRYAHSHKLFLLKTVLNHWQLVSLLSYLRLSFSPVLSNALHAALYFSSFLLPDLPLSCLGMESPEQSKAIIGSALLPMAGLLCALGWGRSALILFTSCTLYLPFITLQTTFPLLACWQGLLFVDMQVQCWERAHLLLVYALLLPSLVLCVLGPFLVLVCYCWKRSVFQTYFPLWSTPLWDFLLLLWKCVTLGIVQVTITSPPLAQVSYLLVCFICISCVPVFLADYAFSTKTHFTLSQVSVLATALSLGFLSYYLYYPPSTDRLEAFVIAMILLLHCTFLLLAVLSLRPHSSRTSTSLSSEAPLGPAPSPADSFAIPSL